ncbi:MAG: acetate--CoA ligase family protein [Candidatus Aminicenantales bacterium]
MDIRTESISRLFERAEREGRNFLLEQEVYEMLEAAGIAAPRRFFLKKGEGADRKRLEALASPEVAVKVVSPLIQHKSDVGGVAFCPAEAAAVDRACADMLRNVPGRFLRWRMSFGQGPTSPLTEAEVEASLRGFLVLEKVDYEKAGFSQELLIGLKNSREFGPVVTVGAGGLDVEYLNERLKEGRALSLASAHLLEKPDVLRQLEPLAVFDKLARDFRGRKALLSELELASTYGRFQELAAHFSAFRTTPGFVIEEAEVNPFVIRAGKLVPLDGVCRFSRDRTPSASRPAEDIRRLLRPSSIGIVGVSEKMNLGHIILSNILRQGFPRENVVVVKPGLKEIEGCRCVPSVAEIPGGVDLFVLTVGAEQSLGLMRELVEGAKARSVIIIAGGIGEKEGSQALEAEIRGLILDNRRQGKPAPVVNGGNCMGILSKPGRYDTTFIPGHKMNWPSGERAGLVFISQSGAYLISRLSKMQGLQPRYAISLGNQIDLTASDYLRALGAEPESKLFAFYIEGFPRGDGFVLARAVTEAVRRGKQVLVYKSGRTDEGRQATSSHTASVAGDYHVCRAVLEEAGAYVAETLFEFESGLQGLLFLEEKKVRGRRAGLISNAGFECVIMSDNLKNGKPGERLELAAFSEKTRARLTELLRSLGIDKLQDIHNPLDLTPVADDTVFAECSRAILDDDNVDCAVVSPVPMTPALQTLPAGPGHSEDFLRPTGVVERLIAVFRATDKPLVVNIDAGPLYDPMAAALERAGLPVFRRSDEAVRFLRKFIHNRLRFRPD